MNLHSSPRGSRVAMTSLAALVTILLAGLSACGGGDDADLTVYSGRAENLIQPLIDKYEEESGLNIEVRYADSVDLALRLSEEKENTPADVFLSQSPGAMEYVDSADLLETLPDDITDLGVAIGGGTSMAISGRQRVLVYNTENVPEDQLPDSIFDLTEPRYLGRVGIAPANASFQDWFTIFRADIGDDAALEWLKALVDGDAPTYDNNNAITQAVARGELDFGLVNHYYNARLLDEDPGAASKNHRFAQGDEGGTMLATAVGALKSGDTKAAEGFVEFLLSEHAQDYFVDETFEYPLAKGTTPDPSLDAPDEFDFGALDQLGDGLKETLELLREAGLEV